ncbi:MAG: glycosyltransferase [bacterium]
MCPSGLDPQGRDGRIHVAHVIGTLQTGGAEMALVNYLRVADQVHFRHTVICLTKAGENADLVRELGVDVVVIRTRIRAMPFDVLRLGRWLSRNRVAVVHTHMFSAAMLGRLAGLAGNVSLLVTTEHGKEPWKRRRHILVDRFLGARTFRQIAVSEDVRRIRMERDGAPEARLVLIPNSVSIPDRVRDSGIRTRIRAEFGLNEEAVVIGSVGRVVDAKAYPVLVEAMALLRDRFPGLFWLQVGDGPEREDLVRAIKVRGLSDRIITAGNRRDVNDILHALDVWVMSSRREGLPVALLEAMAAELPIVATDVGGIPDAVTNGSSARLVPAEDPAALAGAIAEVIEHPELAQRLAAKARADVEARYGNREVALRIEAIYREGLASRGLLVKS